MIEQLPSPQTIPCGLLLAQTEPVTPVTRMLYDRKEAARQLSISLRSLDYLLSRKAFNTKRIGKKVLIPHGELVRFSRQDHPEAIN
jgi:hypothetical protein